MLQTQVHRHGEPAPLAVSKPRRPRPHLKRPGSLIIIRPRQGRLGRQLESLEAPSAATPVQILGVDQSHCAADPLARVPFTVRPAPAALSSPSKIISSSSWDLSRPHPLATPLRLPPRLLLLLLLLLLHLLQPPLTPTINKIITTSHIISNILISLHRPRRLQRPLLRGDSRGNRHSWNRSRNLSRSRSLSRSLNLSSNNPRRPLSTRLGPTMTPLPVCQVASL
jgi:hypothetical protein